MRKFIAVDEMPTGLLKSALPYGLLRAELKPGRLPSTSLNGELATVSASREVPPNALKVDVKEKIMEVVVKRVMRTANSTLSTVHVNGAFLCYVLEDVDRGLKSLMPLEEIQQRKLKGMTCIPEGRYECKITFSAHFKRYMPQLLDVPGFEGIRFHWGNVPADSDGCLLTGMAKGIDKVTESRTAFELLNAKINAAIAAGQKVWVTVGRTMNREQ